MPGLVFEASDSELGLWAPGTPGAVRPSVFTSKFPRGFELEKKAPSGAPPYGVMKQPIHIFFISPVLTHVAHILPSFSIALNQTIAPSEGAAPSTFVSAFQ